MNTRARALPMVVDSLPTVRELVPLDSYDLTQEEDFEEVGRCLVDVGRKAMIGLGELLAWKLRKEEANDEERQTRVLLRYAAAWGASKSSLVKAVVTATKFPEITRPADASPTIIYEVLSGSATPEEAEAGMDRAAGEGFTSTAVREVKMLKLQGLTPEDGPWDCPHLFHRDGFIWARDRQGREVWVAMLNPGLSQGAQAGTTLLRYRGRV